MLAPSSRKDEGGTGNLEPRNKIKNKSVQYSVLYLATVEFISNLSTEVGTKFRRQVAVAQSVYFAYRLRATEFVCCFVI
jgi:hypothetical protein